VIRYVSPAAPLLLLYSRPCPEDDAPIVTAAGWSPTASAPNATGQASTRSWTRMIRSAQTAAAPASVPAAEVLGFQAAIPPTRWTSAWAA